MVILYPSNGSFFQRKETQFERMDLLKEVVDVLGKGNIGYLIGNRECIGKHLVKYLKDDQIDFILRVKEGMFVKQNGVVKKLRDWCKNNKRSKANLSGLFSVTGNEVYVPGFRFRNIKKLEYLILISSDSLVEIYSTYAKKWYIENMILTAR